jgi:hypothetical protein
MGEVLPEVDEQAPPLATIGRSIRQRFDSNGVNALYVSDGSPLPPPHHLFLPVLVPTVARITRPRTQARSPSVGCRVDSKPLPRAGHYRGATAAVDALLALEHAIAAVEQADVHSYIDAHPR